MLESLAAWVLNSYVGEYLGNLNTDQLSIGLLQGEVELENLPLKKDALKKFGLPVQVRAGFVGRICLKIPVYKLKSEPWVITIEDLYLVAGPQVITQYDEEKEKLEVQNKKFADLDAMEAKWKADHESKQESSYYAYSYSAWLSYGTSLVSNIVENLQLNIKNVHLRYEDDISIPNCPLAFGVIIQSLSAQSTDENWIPRFVSRDSTDSMRKLMELEGFSMYWDTKATVLGVVESQDIVLLKKHMEHCTTQGSEKIHEYIVTPVNAKAQLKRNCSSKPLRSRTNPRLICDLQLEKFPLSLSQTQYRQIVEATREFARLNLAWKYRRWRPAVPVKNNAKIWWRFAVDAHTEPQKECHHRQQLEFVLERARDIVQYTKIYERHLVKSDSLTEEMKEKKDQIEQKLSFEEICILRELVMDKVHNEHYKSKATEETTGRRPSLLQSWFPSWTGWYSCADSQDSLDDRRDSFSDSEALSKIEEEILSALDSAENDSFLKRDAVFAQLNFTLQQVSFALIVPSSESSPVSSPSKQKVIMELEFSDVKTSIETRPRSSSHVFEIKLGALYIRDTVSQNPVFPLLVAPQNREVAFPHSRQLNISISPRSTFWKFASMGATSPANQQLPPKPNYLFELQYERKPFSSSADHRLFIWTRSLDMVYNPKSVASVKEFFSELHSKDPSNLNLTAAARNRYEVLKRQTKAELRQKWDQILEGEQQFLETTRWEIQLNISAPQIIIPEDINDKNSTIVIFDLGRLQFSNSSKVHEVSIKSEAGDSEEEDVFETPCSSPPDEDFMKEESVSSVVQEGASISRKSSFQSQLTEPSLRERMYERYTMELCDMQILVGKVKDNWRFALLRGASTMHFLDRFSITVQMERRLIQTTDPQWPSITLFGGLPKLIVHINEQKVNALHTCMDTLSQPILQSPSVIQRNTSAFSLHQDLDDLVGEDSGTLNGDGVENQVRDVAEDSVLLVTQFCVEHVSIEVQSRGRSIVELQVSGVNAMCSKRPMDTSLSLCVHGLLLVDAMQTYGPDFELLLASHKHVSMDSISGSLRDSDPSSPLSPASPDAIHSPPHDAATHSIATQSPLSSLQGIGSKAFTARLRTLCPPLPYPCGGVHMETRDNNALINVEVIVVHSPETQDNAGDTLQVVSVQFNNLDVIANQETIVELVGFMKRTFLKPSDGMQLLVKQPSPTPVEGVFSEDSAKEKEKQVRRTEVTFDFHRLNVLLLHAVIRDQIAVGQKVATATMTGAWIQASIGAEIKIQGALGGLQVLDVVSEATKHQRVLSIGYDPTAEQSTALYNRLQSDLYKPVSDVEIDPGPQKALTFAIRRSGKFFSHSLQENPAASVEMDSSSEQKEMLEINLRMASVSYVHSPLLVHKLATCAAEFKEYLHALATSIKTAATEMAIGMVSKRTEELASSFYGTYVDERKRHASDPVTEIPSKSIDEGMDSPSEQEFNIEYRIDVILQTPVIVLPSSPASYQVLVAHLGQITVQNQDSTSLTSLHCSCDPVKKDNFFVEVQNMSLYSLNCDLNLREMNIRISQMASSSRISASLVSVQELYACTNHGKPILHDTIIELTIEKSVLVPTVDYMSPFLEEQERAPLFHPKEQELLQVTGSVVKGFKVVLSKHQYEQLFQTLNNLNYEDSEASSCVGIYQSRTLETLPEDSCLEFGSRASISEDVSSKAKVSPTSKAYVAMRANFQIPECIIELVGEMSDGEQGIVNLSFQEFVLDYSKDEPFETVMQVTLRALVMEDLLGSVESRHRYLMKSSGSHPPGKSVSGPPVKSHYLSTSCPDFLDHAPRVIIHSSLPDRLHTQNVFAMQLGKRPEGRSKSSALHYRDEGTKCPGTPPPSPSGQRSPSQLEIPDDTLVCMNVKLVDKRSPYFAAKYNNTHRFVNVDFNCLEAIVNLQTWVMVLDFLGVGSSLPHYKHEIGKTTTLLRQASKGEEQDVEDHQEIINSETDINVRSLSIVLNKPDYELAKANISSFKCQTSLRSGNMTLQGTLGSLSLLDLTPYGQLYREKFVTSDKQEVLSFHVFRYGSPDPHLKREYDMFVKCQMASVQYVHTQRFQMETLAFIQHFNQLQDFMARIRASSAGTEVDTSASRASRMRLDIKAAAPVIIVPLSHSSSDVMVADLGKLTVSNKFLFAGTPGTMSKVNRGIVTSTDIMTRSVIGSLEEDSRFNAYESTFSMSQSSEDHQCLLDVMSLELSDMYLFSAVQIKKSEDGKKAKQDGHNLDIDLRFPSFYIKKQGYQFLKEKFMLKLQVERNLDSAISHSVPDVTMHAAFSSVHFVLDPSQYQLFCGILKHNLGEPIDQSSSMNSGKMEVSETQMVSNEETWTCMAIHMDLVNVTLELVKTNTHRHCANAEVPLAKFDFISSQLSYESYSDQSKDVDLVSHEIRVSDTRYRDAPVNTRPNVFVNILQPTRVGSQKTSLQAEVHYRSTQHFARVTVLLNNMRVMGIFDWLKEVKDFLTNTEGAAASVSSSKVATPSSTRTSLQPKGIEPLMEAKLNVTDTELVIVEDPALWDSNAVIIKSTAVITHTPNKPEKPLSCSLQSLEVFSCILGVEDETALSIIDPVTVNVDVVDRRDLSSRLNSPKFQHTLEITIMSLNLRLSYHDVTMFMRILDSIHRQMGVSQAPQKSPPANGHFSKAAVSRLKVLGFSTEDCLKALDECGGRLDDAALWLTQNATHLMMSSQLSSSLTATYGTIDDAMSINSFKLHVSSGILCVIDDCKDSDVPLVELGLTDFNVVHSLSENQEGNLCFGFSGDYYNRPLSGWEPFIEPWTCHVTWSLSASSSADAQKLSLRVEASDPLNLNATSAALDLYQNVKKNWTEEYYNLTKKDNSHDAHPGSSYRRRSPFVPFALKNDTGCKLSFATVVTCSDKPILSHTSAHNLSWREVLPDQVVPFSFEGRGKMRHRDSHKLKLHQLVVRVDGWQPTTPVSVDRVGIYFRDARSVMQHSFGRSDGPAARIVFAITLEGNARKLVAIRSALMIRNSLNDTLEVKLEKRSMDGRASSYSMILMPQTTLPIPLNHIYSSIVARPLDRSLAFCDTPLQWQHVSRPGDEAGDLKTCVALGFNRSASAYKFSVEVKRGNYPPVSTLPHLDVYSSVPSPGHKITVIPPLVIVNLLPYELKFNVREASTIESRIKPSKEVAVHEIGLTQDVTISFHLENFKWSKALVIHPANKHFESHIEMYDRNERLLVLQVRATRLTGGAMKLCLSAPYWLVNRTGLPLLFRQEGTQGEAAGQFEEHEVARSVVPLLFSFSDREASAMCSMRVGKVLHENNGIPQWCTRFHLEKGIKVRRLHVTPRDSRPDWVYIIGIDIRRGRGRYQDTYIVTLSPRYQLNNHSSHKLEFAQKFSTLKKTQQYTVSATKGAGLPFHWPRFDLDHLLCVRIADAPSCHWSGGFIIDKNNSFQLNIRDGEKKSHFLHVEISLQGATYQIVFTDAESIPPPFRIDNLSEVAVTFNQMDVLAEHLKNTVKPHSSVPYAWDEPTYRPYITCSAPGGSSAHYNMNTFGEGDKLFYENFIYIAFTGTFLNADSGRSKHLPGDDITSQQLVLDVPRGTKVILNRKEPGQRSQLWRMTSGGLLIHEGSSPPRDPRRAYTLSSPSDLGQMYVLDIGGLSSLPGEYMPLVLRKADERRRLTQTWRFTEDGRLCCGHPNMYVQAKDGFRQLCPGNEVVLGPSQLVTYMTMENGVPIEQAVSRQKLREGSGVLMVKVVADGPTRVLQVSDLQQKQRLLSRTSPESNWVVVEEFKKQEDGKKQIDGASLPATELQALVHFHEGVVVSVVNHLREELICISLNNIVMEYSRTASTHSLDGSIQHIQVDNQLFDAEKDVVLYESPSSKADETRHLPALRFIASRVPMPHLNAEIFKYLIVTVKNMTLTLEEKLLLKLLQFMGCNQNSSELEQMDESESHPPRAVKAYSTQVCRFHFGTLKLSLQRLKLSVLTSSHLPPELQEVKQKMGLRLIRFEDANVELAPFLTQHMFETPEFIFNSIVEHYQEELKSQAAKILGAVDFLGNPLGFVNDVSDGLSELLHGGNFGGLLKSVAHGLSDSTAKVMGSLSDSLVNVTMDNRHHEIRKRIKQDSTARGSDHIKAGLRGLGFGLFGGVTSIITETYEGVTAEGVPGFFTGLGRGLVGTVTKPTVGMLDLASSAAIAVRDTSRRHPEGVPTRCRPPRLCVGPGGLLPRYSLEQALGQEFLYVLNERNFNERFISCEYLQTGSDEFRVLISSENIHFLSRGGPSISSMELSIPLGNLHSCVYNRSDAGVLGETRYYIQPVIKTESSSGMEAHFKRPQVRCENEQVAQKVVQQINYAKNLFEERKFMVSRDEDSEE